VCPCHFVASAGRLSGRLLGEVADHVLRRASLASAELRRASVLQECGAVLRRFLHHGSVEILVVSLQPPGPTVLNRLALPAIVELGEESAR
jgi:hypothetical protein